MDDQRTDELMKVAVALVASGRATISEAARLVGCSRQRLHEACGSYAHWCDWGKDEARNIEAGERSMRSNLRRRWARMQAKPISRFDMTGPRREYLDRIWSRLVASHDREQAEIERAEAGDYIFEFRRQ
jgi:hypothetical protein